MKVAPIDDLTAALGAVGDLVADVRQDQWSASTPCPEWDVRELVSEELPNADRRAFSVNYPWVARSSDFGSAASSGR
jgi:hypothetical protein